MSGLAAALAPRFFPLALPGVGDNLLREHELQDLTARGLPFTIAHAGH